MLKSIRDVVWTEDERLNARVHYSMYRVYYGEIARAMGVQPDIDVDYVRAQLANMEGPLSTAGSILRGLGADAKVMTRLKDMEKLFERTSRHIQVLSLLATSEAQTVAALNSHEEAGDAKRGLWVIADDLKVCKCTGCCPALPTAATASCATPTRQHAGKCSEN